MRKQRKGIGPAFFKAERSPALIILSISFLLGIFLGFLFAGTLSAEEGNTLNRFIAGYLSTAKGDGITPPDAFTSFWNTFRWPAGILLFSLTPAGMLGIPFLICTRGFLLSFAISCFIRILGSSGAILSGLLFGLPALFSLPALFLFGVQGLDFSFATRQRRQNKKNKQHFFCSERGFHIALGILLFWFSLAVERGVIPPLLLALAGNF